LIYGVDFGKMRNKYIRFCAQIFIEVGASLVEYYSRIPRESYDSVVSCLICVITIHKGKKDKK